MAENIDIMDKIIGIANANTRESLIHRGSTWDEETPYTAIRWIDYDRSTWNMVSVDTHDGTCGQLGRHILSGWGRVSSLLSAHHVHSSVIW